MKRIRWASIIVGVVATSATFWLLFLVVGLPLFPNLYPEGAIPTGTAWYVHVVRATLPPLASLLLTFFLGGLVSGGVTSVSWEFYGALSVAVTAFGGFAWFVGPLVPWIWEPISNPGEVFTWSDNVGNLIVLSVMFCAVFPFIVFAGYLGGRLGGRLRDRLVNQATP